MRASPGNPRPKPATLVIIGGEETGMDTSSALKRHHELAVSGCGGQRLKTRLPLPNEGLRLLAEVAV